MYHTVNKKSPKIVFDIKINHEGWFTGYVKDINNSGTHINHHIIANTESNMNFFETEELCKIYLDEKVNEYLKTINFSNKTT